jgi:uncharacterized protein
MDNDNKIFPGFGYATLLLLLLIVLEIVALFGFTIIKTCFLALQNCAPDKHFDIPILSISSILSFSLIIFLIRIVRKQSIMMMISFKSVSFMIILPIIMISFGVECISSEFDNILRYLLPIPKILAEMSNEITNINYFSFIELVVVAPLTEELLFRGIFLPAFLSRYKTSNAVILSALLFSIFHLNPYQFLNAFCLGIVFAILYIKTNSIWPCIIGHSFSNALIFILRLLHEFYKLNIPGVTGFTKEELMGKIQFQPLWFNILGILFLICGFILLNKLFNKKNALITIASS